MYSSDTVYLVHYGTTQTPITTALQALLTAIKAPSHFQDFPSLDKEKQNYVDWSETCLDALTLAGLPCIRMRLTSTEKASIRDLTTSKEIWDALQARHRKDGVVTQISPSTSTCFRYSAHTNLNTTTNEIKDVVKHIFDIGLPDQDALNVVVMLNALSGEFTNIRENLDTLLSSASLTLRDMQGEPLDEELWNKGGAMEGKRDKVLRRRNKRSGSTPARKKFVDENGKAYFLVESAETPEFVASAMPSDITPQATLNKLVDREEVSDSELSMMVFDGVDMRISVDWNNLPADQSTEPFYLDSGATIHLFPCPS
ncbi:hypothetical protein B0H14DRAFT_2651253 [Mycena olivaceomarginata]|nr:hypothetical protein B0H14DRAFT_2651253 [Mycena olivaceomarginata]